MLKNLTRCLSLILVLALSLSLLPVPALGAEETGTTQPSEPQTTEPLSTEPQLTAIARIKAEIDDILTRYLGATVMSAEEISEKVAAMDWETYQTARWEISELGKSAESALTSGAITAAEAETLEQEKIDTLSSLSDALEKRAATDNTVETYATSTYSSVLQFSSGSTSITPDSNNSNMYTLSLSRSNFTGKKTDTITIKNLSTDTKYLVKFSYSGEAPGYGDEGDYDIAVGTDAEKVSDKDGIYELKIEPSGTFTITLWSNDSNIVGGSVYNFVMIFTDLSPIYEDTDLTVNFDANLGSVSHKNTAGTTAAVTAGSTLSNVTEGETLTATAKSGKEFVGWVDANGKILTTETTYSVAPNANAMTVKAEFSSGTAYFATAAGTYKTFEYLNEYAYYTLAPTYLFNDLGDALDAAKESTSDKFVVLMSNGTLPAGTYTVPSGVTLVMPYDNMGTTFITGAMAENTSASPTGAFRTLTMANGANIVIDKGGKMSVPSKICAGGAGGAGAMPIGKYGHVKMNSGSKITVNGGGTLSVFGYISGDGEVEALSTSKVYESFQIMDFRGGSATGTIATNNEGAFPLTQYYVQNIEVPLKLHAGAEEIAYTTLYMNSTVIDSSVTFIGNSGCMFNLTSGYLIKKYDRANDRQQYDIHGNLSIEKFSITIKYIVPYTISSEDYIMPISNSMTININSGTVTMDANMCLLPGSEFTIASGASVIMGSGKSLYLYDLDEWKGCRYIYPDADMKAARYVTPTRTKTRTAADLKDAMLKINGTLDASKGYVYTSAGGANICSDGGGVAKIPDAEGTTANQLIQDSTNLTVNAIPFNSAWLTNVIGGEFASFTITENGTTDDTNTYYYTGNGTTGYWYETAHETVCQHPNAVKGTIVDPTCAQQGYTPYSCPDCSAGYIGDLTAKLPHNYDEGKQIVEPTYSAAGFWCYTCSNCDNKYTEPITVATVGTTTYPVLSTAVADAAKNGNTVQLKYDVKFEDAHNITTDVVIIRNGFNCSKIRAGAIKDKDGKLITQYYLCTSDYAYIITSGTAKFTPDDSICYVSVNDTVLNPADDGSYTIPVTKDTSFVTAKHAWDLATGQCGSCSDWLIRYDAIQLSVLSEIQLRLKFKIHSDLFTEYPNAQVYVTEEGNAIELGGKAWNTALSGAAAVAEVESGGYLNMDKDGVRYVVNQGIASGELTGNVTVQFKTDVDGTVIPFYDKDTQDKAKDDVLTKQVTDFAVAVYDATKKEDFNAATSANDELWELCRWAVTYGRYAQEFYGTHTAELADSILGSRGGAPNSTASDTENNNKALESYKRTVTAAEGYNGPTASGQRLNLDSKVYLRSYFTPPKGMTAQQVIDSGTYKVKLTVPTNNGEGVGTGANFEWSIDKNGRLYLDIQDIPPAYWNDTFTITITDGSDKTYVLTTSPMTWCASCVAANNQSTAKHIAQYNMALAMYDYAKAAETYFVEKAKLGN